MRAVRRTGRSFLSPLPMTIPVRIVLWGLWMLVATNDCRAGPTVADAAASEQRAPRLRSSRVATAEQKEGESSSERAAPFQRQKSDRDRGWPLWFPRAFPDDQADDDAAADKTAEANRAKKDVAPREEAAPVPATAKPRNGGDEPAASDNDRRPEASSPSPSPPPLPSLFRRKMRNETRVLVITTDRESGGGGVAQVESSTTTAITTTATTAASNTTSANDVDKGSADEGVVIPIATTEKETATATQNGTAGTAGTASPALPAATTASSTNETQPAPDASSAASPESAPPSQSSSSDQQSPPQPASGGLILLRPGWSSSPPSNATPYRLYRRHGWSGGPLDPQQQQPGAPTGPGRWGLGGGGGPMSPNEERVIELASSVLATVTRLWLLRSISGWLARQEESIQPTQHFVWERLNDQFVRDSAALSTAMRAPPPGCTPAQWRRHQRRLWRRNRRRGNVPGSDSSRRGTVALALPRHAPEDAFARTVVVVDLGIGDSKDGPDNAYLADIVSFLVQQHRRHAFGTNATTLGPAPLEVVWLVQSPGGSVASFGLAASHIRRLSQEPGVQTTVCVDKYAASGGYMIASQAHQLVAAPFASVGSVGVILEGLNFHDLARKYGVQPLVLKAGDSKNPITTFGPITKHDLEQQSQQLRKVHVAFQELVVQGRPWLRDKLDQVASGNVFLGQEALDLRLIDRLQTSSEYLLERVEAGDRVLKLHKSNPSRFPRRGVHLSPLDVLPHLRSFLRRHQSRLGPWVVQGATCLGFLRHLYDSYFR